LSRVQTQAGNGAPSADERGNAVIRVADVAKRFGGIHAVNGVSLDVAAGSITGLIGPNGAGKSTLFNMIAGLIRTDRGRIELAGRDSTGVPPHRLFHQGLVRTFQIPHELARMTVRENLMLVPEGQRGESLFAAWLRWGRVKSQLLDEPGAGVNPTLMGRLSSAIERLNRERGYTFCVIEHDMDLIARLCDPVHVMANGSLIASGPMHEIRQNPDVRDAYLGGGEAPAG